VADSPPAAPKRKGFDLQHPGGKEYAIAIGGALALYFIIKWFQNRNSSSSAAAPSSDSGTTAPSSPTGLNLASLMTWIQDQQSSPATTTSTTTTGGGTTTATATKNITVPDVTGKRANTAIGQLESDGLSWVSTTGDRNSALEYTVSSQSPKAGTKVTAGTKVSLAFKQLS
jgi:hypothetical protein